MKTLKAFIKSSEAPQRANQLTGFYMRATMPLNALNEYEIYHAYNAHAL